MRRKLENSFAPSIFAASKISFGICSNAAFASIMPKTCWLAMHGRISAQYLLMSLSFCMMRYCGTIVIVVGTIMTATSIPNKKRLPLNRSRAKA